MRIITISNQKGGVAKTTTANALAAGLKRRGYRVLAIDLDPQANLSTIADAANEDLPSIYEVMDRKRQLAEAIQHKDIYDIVQSNIMLSSADVQFLMPAREYLLKRALATVADNYVFTVIDTPPSLGIMTINALSATNDLIIPTKAEMLSLIGIRQLNDMIIEIKDQINPGMNISGILFTQYNPRTAIASQMKELADSISNIIGAPIFHTTIRNTVKVQEAQAYQTELIDYSPSSTAAQDYENFVSEYLEGLNNA